MFAQRLKELRKKRGLTQIQLAQQFNITKGAVGMWETGKREPDLETVNQIAKFFHVTADYLLENVNEAFFTWIRNGLFVSLTAMAMKIVNKKRPSPFRG